MELYQKNLQKAEATIPKIEKLIVLAQVSKNKRLILITLEEIEKTLKCCISTMLHYDYLYKRVKLSKDPISNLQTFEAKSSKNYSITQSELNSIKEILSAAKDHKASPMEFMKQEEVVIMSDNQRITTLSMEKLTNFLSITKNILEKIKERIKL